MTCGYGAFAALTGTAEAERSMSPLTWLGWRDSNPLYRSQSPVCYHYTTSHCDTEAGTAGLSRFSWGGIWGSNPRHPEPQSGALPTELIPPNRRSGFPPVLCQRGPPRNFSIALPPGRSYLKPPKGGRLPCSKHKAQRSGFVFERKKELTDMELSRHLRKPRKRNGVSFF